MPWLSWRRCRRHVASANPDSRKLDIWQSYVSVDAARSDHQAAHGVDDNSIFRRAHEVHILNADARAWCGNIKSNRPTLTDRVPGARDLDSFRDQVCSRQK